MRAALGLVLITACMGPQAGAVSLESHPVAVTNGICPIVNEARTYSILGLISWGDSSIEAARNMYGGTLRISLICEVSRLQRSFLGIGYAATVVRGAYR
jgi:hypothetical protein